MKSKAEKTVCYFQGIPVVCEDYKPVKDIAVDKAVEIVNNVQDSIKTYMEYTNKKPKTIKTASVVITAMEIVCIQECEV